MRPRLVKAERPMTAGRRGKDVPHKTGMHALQNRDRARRRIVSAQHIDRILDVKQCLFHGRSLLFFAEDNPVRRELSVTLFTSADAARSRAHFGNCASQRPKSAEASFPAARGTPVLPLCRNVQAFRCRAISGGLGSSNGIKNLPEAAI